MNFRALGFVSLAALALLATALPASAEIVFLTSGRTLSVKTHKIDGESIVLTLRSGTLVTCDKALISKIEPDEVPYPEPPVAVSEPGLAARLTTTKNRTGRFWRGHPTARSSRRSRRRTAWIRCSFGRSSRSNPDTVPGRDRARGRWG